MKGILVVAILLAISLTAWGQSTGTITGNVLDASQFAMVVDASPGGLKLIPVVVNVTSALPIVHAAVPWLQVPRARLAAVAAVALSVMASVDTQP